MNKIYVVLLLFMISFLGQGLICNFTPLKYYSFSKCPRNSVVVIGRQHYSSGSNPGSGFCLPLVFDEETYYEDHPELKALNDKKMYELFINDLKIQRKISNERVIYFLKYRRFIRLNYQSSLLKEQISNLNNVKKNEKNQPYFTSEEQLAINNLMEQLKNGKKVSNQELIELFDAD